jgi:hypothetical protein
VYPVALRHLAYRFAVLQQFPKYLHLLFVGIPFPFPHFFSLGLWYTTLLAWSIFGKFIVGRTFGMMTNMMKGIMIRSIGLARARFNIGLMNLVYNLMRYAYLRRVGACA